MADRLTKEQRSANMRRIRHQDTKPELMVRRRLHRLGFRFRLHRKGLPGKPDIVFGPRKKVIFVHGCFWHSHESADCPDWRRPKSNRDYWGPKLRRNAERDRSAVEALHSMGWETLVLWECELKDAQQLEERLLGFLGASGPKSD